MNRIPHIDLVRLLSVLLVMFGHLISVAGGAKDIPGVIGPLTPLPLIDATQWNLWRAEVFLIQQFGTQTAILGVTLFFLITGYLMPMMLERYSRQEFAINRFFRIFPVLIAGSLMIGVFVGVTQGITFPLKSYLASWTLTYSFVGVIPVAGILWTLIVEVLFYCAAFSVGRFTIQKLLLVQSLLIAVVISSVQDPGSLFFLNAASQAKYMLLICIGSAIFLAEKETTTEAKLGLVLSSMSLAYAGLQLFKLGHPDPSTYANLGTIIIAVLIYYGFFLARNSDAMKRIPKFVFRMADYVYPLYLVHVAFGLGTMALVREFNSDPYFMLLCALAASFVSAAIIHHGVEQQSIAKGRSLVAAMRKKESTQS
jgi:peptidoglycan/LPS O-acetylase OafA/YrhL